MEAFRRHRRAAACLMILLMFVGCVVVLATVAGSVWPTTGDDTKKKDNMIVDYSHAEDGYIMIKRAECSARLKLRISKGDMTYTYDLNNDNEYEVFPLQMGSGAYKCSLYKNVSGSKYSKEAEVSIDVTLKDENAAFLCPSQYVNYTAESPAALMSDQICAELTTDAEKVEAIRKFMVSGFTYDYVRALTIKESYLGDVDGCFESRMGLCQDLAAIAACMLRVQGIPTKLVIGYAGNVYHAWNLVLIDGEYQRLDITAELSGMGANTEYTPERYY